METRTAFKERWRTWRRKETERRKRAAVETLRTLLAELSPGELSRVWLFGSFAWPWSKPHEYSDLDFAVDDEGLDVDIAALLAKKIFSIAERFFGEEDVDICFMSELPNHLKERIRKYGKRIDHVEP